MPAETLMPAPHMHTIRFTLCCSTYLATPTEAKYVLVAAKGFFCSWYTVGAQACFCEAHIAGFLDQHFIQGVHMNLQGVSEEPNSKLLDSKAL
jgi:hypothetical protein